MSNNQDKKTGNEINSENLSALDNRMFVDAVYIYLAKAFDTASNVKLIQKLAMLLLGIGGKLTKCDKMIDFDEFHIDEDEYKSRTPHNTKDLKLEEFEKLSSINSAINKMTKMELVTRLRTLHLNTMGNKTVAVKRLKNYYRLLKMPHVIHQISKPMFKFICVIDFEATCDENNRNYIHEIIEFPAILIDTKLKETVVFHSYCRPNLNKTLTEFCKTLTGISQEQVDKADSFPDVLSNFENWLQENIGDNFHKKVAILSDGPWDVSRFLLTQCKLCKIPVPKYAKQWINIRKSFRNLYNCEILKGITSMLDALGLAFEGRQHSGLDDSKNIARIAINILDDGYHLDVNERLHEE
ncbi:3'-5' exoribonuclease 1 [Nymphon striatum]|nr:3'-5' exoribonuclease 1 [Nymphon striatum]